jgi:amidase
VKSELTGISADEFSVLDGLGVASLIASREVTVAEVTAAARVAIDRVNPTINAVIDVFEDRFEHPELDLDDGPFRGVPFLIKDVSEHFGGRRMEYGSRLCAGQVVADDDHYARMIKATGVNLVGRSAAPEFSMSLTTATLLYGETHNPWRLHFSTSGSSGGAGAAVAAGLVPIAHSSDIGGSTRGPAAWCGTVGLHPSRGRVSTGPGMSESGDGMAQSSVLTRSMRDTAAMLDAISIPQPGDPFEVRRPDRPYSSFLSDSGPRLRIGFSTDPLLDAPVDPEIAAAVERTAATLASLGHHVEQSAPSFDLVAMDAALTDLWYFQWDVWLDSLAALNGREVGPDTVEQATLNFYHFARGRSVDAYFAALDDLNTYRRQIGNWFAQYDIWLSPTCAQVSQPNAEYGMNLAIPPLEFLLHEDRPCQFMVWANVCGAPAISLPLAHHSNGLPIGIQLGAKPGYEELLIGLGAELEIAMPWHDRLPPMHVTRIRQTQSTMQ